LKSTCTGAYNFCETCDKELVPRLISFFGPDGAGKSTQAELLSKHFQSHKIKAKQVWIRSPHTLAYLVSRFFLKIGFYRVVSNHFGRQLKIPAVYKNQLLKLFWSVIELFSALPLILFRVYLPLFLGYTIVAERYVVDTVVNIAYYINDVGFLQSRTARLLLCFVPKNTLFIHLDSDYSNILKRRSYTAEPQDFIEFQRTGYKAMGSSVGALFVDTSRTSVKQTYMQIMHWLKNNKVVQ